MTDSFGSGASAEQLAGIYGTEKDKVNCPFYWKIGACRHGEKCNRNHNKPTYSQTILIPHIYPNPIATPFIDTQGNQLEYDPQFLKEHFEEFYEDVYDELSKYGRVDELNVCDNIAEHMLGNVYVKFHYEEDAQRALQGLKERFYAGRVLTPEFSPVTDFREARCRQFEQKECSRGGNCNFMHLKKVDPELGYELFGDRFKIMRYHDALGGGGFSGGGGGNNNYNRSSSSHHHRPSRRDDNYDYDDRRGGEGGYERRSYRDRGSRRSRSPQRSSHYNRSSSRRARYGSESPSNNRTPPSSSSSRYSSNYPSSGQKRKREEDDDVVADGFGVVAVKKMRSDQNQL